MHDELERLWSEHGLTVLFVTHNVREAVRLGDRVVLLGRAQDGSRPSSPYRSSAHGGSTPRRSRRGQARSRTRCGRRCVVMSADLGLRLFEAPDVGSRPDTGRRPAGHPARTQIWAATWPKLIAVAIVLAIWQASTAHWRPVRPALTRGHVARAWTS